MKSGLDENSMVPVFVVERDLHLHYPLESLPPLPCSETDNISRHTKMRFITSELGPPGVLRLRPVASYGGERNNNDEAMPRGGRLVIIRLFVTITIMLSRSKIVVFLLALHDTTICYFRPAPVSAIGLQFLFQSWVQESRSWKNRPHYS